MIKHLGLVLLLGLQLPVLGAHEEKSCLASSSLCPMSSSCENKKPFPICQDNLPFTIRRSGNYELESNVTYKGSHNAITIQADNVTLNLNGFSIFLTNPNATGIFDNGASNFVIENGNVTNLSTQTPNGFDISVFNAQNGLINAITTNNNFNGIRIQNASNIQINNSNFSGAADAAGLVINASNISFDNDIFSASNNGLEFSGIGNQNARVLNCSFPSATFQNLLVQQMNGMVVNNCSFTEIGSAPNGKAALAQFGDADPLQNCNDVTFTHCTIVNRSANTSPEGLGIYQGSGFLVDSCVIDTTNLLQDPAADLSGIHISNPGLGVNGTIASDVMITNCVVQGPATDGFYPDVGSSNVVIENCLATGAQKDGIFLAGTSASKVQNNLVTNCGTNGIFLGEASFSNAILNNTVINNGFNPITDSLPPLQSGIGISPDSFNNTVQNNQALSNANSGINNQGTGNTFYFNTASSNPTNYIGVPNVSVPGGAAKTGENISQ